MADPCPRGCGLTSQHRPDGGACLTAQVARLTEERDTARALDAARWVAMDEATRDAAQSTASLAATLHDLAHLEAPDPAPAVTRDEVVEALRAARPAIGKPTCANLPQFNVTDRDGDGSYHPTPCNCGEPALLARIDALLARLDAEGGPRG